jgi:hypothetical protein
MLRLRASTVVSVNSWPNARGQPHDLLLSDVTRDHARSCRDLLRTGRKLLEVNDALQRVQQALTTAAESTGGLERLLAEMPAPQARWVRALLPSEHRDGPYGAEWEELLAAPRASPGALRAQGPTGLPTAPGVYVWSHGEEIVYTGRATGASGLRGRVWSDHLSTRPDLSKSTFRRWVAVHELGVTRADAKNHRFAAHEVAAVNAWVDSCRIGWIERETKRDARRLEHGVLSVWEPPFNVG